MLESAKTKKKISIFASEMTFDNLKIYNSIY